MARRRRVLTLLTPGVVVRDDFLAANTTAITALASPWTKHATGATNTAAPTVEGGRVAGENAASTSLYYRADAVPPSANYAVECDVVMRSDNNASNAGVCGRIAAGANTFYSARYVTAGNVWQLVKVVAGSSTTLGQVSATLTADQPYRLSLDLRGSMVVMRVDGVVLAAAADADVVAPGLAGIRFSGASTPTTGVHLDAWRVFV